ncbi:histidine phosphatase family protein [Virgibacillus kimchii]
MTTICLIRHGETDWNVERRLQGMTDIPLNPRGVQQAEACSAYLASSSYDVLISSPLKRAKKTAEIINQQLHLPLQLMDQFKERYFGDAEGMGYEARRIAYPDKNYPKQENKEDFQARIMKGLQEVTRLYPHQRVLLVAHGAVINTILTTFSGNEHILENNRLMNGCISNIYFENETWNVEDVNRTAHLPNFFQ